MGKCVVCGKSAGPFYSLHKSCLSVYQGVRKCLHDAFFDCIDSAEYFFDPVDTIRACKPSKKFSKSQFKKLVIKAWEKQAELVFKDSLANLAATKHLLQIADEFGINNEDVEDYLLVRLSNAEYFDRIRNNQPVNKQFEHVPEGIELEQYEFVIWEFSDASKTEQQRFSQEKQWVVLSSLLNNILMKKRPKELAIKTQKSGILLITNQGFYYKNNENITRTKFTEIHSITPMKNGVRIQANLKGAMPATYVTGDGRFTYALLQYAQGLNV